MRSLALAWLAVVACSSSPPDGAALDAGAAHAPIPDASAACAASADCPRGLVCAYAVTAGCGARGECVYTDCVEDPECPPAPTFAACGCDGAPVPYVTADYTAAPVASPEACAADASRD
jgi:hypothetical protein